MAILQTQLETAHEKLSNQKEQLKLFGEKFRFEFRNLAQGIMDEKTAKFIQVNEEKRKAILDPLKLELVDFRKKWIIRTIRKVKNVSHWAKKCSG